jgi:ribose-phosphate pyrophosphokinase
LATPLIDGDVRRHEAAVGELMIVSPDVGGVARARSLAERLNADLAIVDKRRSGPGVSEVMNIIGDVKDRRCILFDDIVDSAGTLCNAAEALKSAGAASVAAYVTHGVLSGAAVERVGNSVLTELVTTDSIEATDPVAASKNIRQITCANLIGEAIRRIANEESVSKLFD